MTKPKHGPLLIGPLSPTKYGKTGKSFIQESWGSTPAATVCNASAKGTYNQADSWKNSAMRPGCLDFLRCKSVGVGH
jgi:hypothetical protein